MLIYLQCIVVVVVSSSSDDDDGDYDNYVAGYVVSF